MFFINFKNRYNYQERSKSLREEIDDLNKSNKQLKIECENMKQKIMNSDKRNLKSLQGFEIVLP